MTLLFSDNDVEAIAVNVLEIPHLSSHVDGALCCNNRCLKIVVEAIAVDVRDLPHLSSRVDGELCCNHMNLNGVSSYDCVIVSWLSPFQRGSNILGYLLYMYPSVLTILVAVIYLLLLLCCFGSCLRV